MSTTQPDPALARAAASFANLFNELRRRFPERDHILEQVELALLAREHILLFGPPGTGKSELASSVTRSIVDEGGKPSLYARQIVETTVQQDLIGPVDFKVLTETGRTQHRTDEGLLNFELAVLDEAFDARDLLLRSLFSVLNEREFNQGPTVVRAKLATAIFTTNRYLSELLGARPETLLAFSDRVVFAGYVPKGFAEAGSRLTMLAHAAGRGQPVRSRLLLSDLGALRAAAQAVEVDDEALAALATFADLMERYLAEPGNDKRSVATRYLSGRALSKAVGIWKAAVLRDRLIKGKSEPLRATPADLGLLRPFFTLAGPPPERLEPLLALSPDPRDQGQLKLIGFEQGAFNRALGEVKGKLKQDQQREAAELGLAEIFRPDVATDRLMAGSLAASKYPLAKHPRHREDLARLMRASAEAFVRESASDPDRAEPSFERVGQIKQVVDGLRLLGEPELATRVAVAARHEVKAEVLATPLREAGEEFESTQPANLKELAARAQARIQALDEWQRHIEEISHLAGDAERVSAATAALLADARAKTAKALRRRAGKLVPKPKTGSDLSLLHAEVAPLAEVDKLLSQLSPGAGRLRIDLVTARAAGLLRKELAGTAVQRVQDLLEFVREAEKRLRQLEVEPSAVLRTLRPAVAERLQTWLNGRPNLIRPNPGTYSEAGYLGLQGVCTAWAERAAVGELVRLLRGEGDAVLLEVGRRLEELDVREVTEIVRYLEEWFRQVTKDIQPPGEIESLPAAEAAWAIVSGSRFYRQAWRDKELVSLRERIRELSELQSVGEAARGVAGQLEQLLRTSEHFGRALLDRRAQLSSAA